MGDNEFLPQEGPAAFVRVWRRVILDPQGFYREMPSGGGFENPLIFLGISALAYFLLKLIVGGVADGVNGLFLVVLAYIFGPGILMLVCQFLFQGEGDYEGTVRLSAYAGASLVLAWVPILGIVAFVYSLYLVFLGAENVHKLDATKAAIATLVAALVTVAVIAFVLKDRLPHPLL